MSEQEKREEDLVPMRIVGLAMDPFNNSPIVLLKDKRPLFEIIAAMRKKRAVEAGELEEQHSTLFDEEEDLEEDDSDESSESLEAGAATGMGETSEDTTPSLNIDTREDLDRYEEESDDDLEEADDLDDLDDTSEDRRRSGHGLRESDVETLLAAMEGKTDATVPHPSSPSAEDSEEDAPDVEVHIGDRDDDDDDRRALLPIWIGEAEANAIATEMLGIVTPRPMTHDLLKQAIAAMGGAVYRVIVTDIRENTFYAAIEVKRGQGNDVVSLDARPSDALAIALRFGADIFVHDRVLEKTQQREKNASNSFDELNEIQEERWKEIVQRRSEDSLDKYKQ